MCKLRLAGLSINQIVYIHVATWREWIGVYKQLEIETNTLQWFRCVLLAMCKKALGNGQTFGAWGKNECTSLLEIPHLTRSNINILTSTLKRCKGPDGYCNQIWERIDILHYDRVNGCKWYGREPIYIVVCSMVVEPDLPGCLSPK